MITNLQMYITEQTPVLTVTGRWRLKFDVHPTTAVPHSKGSVYVLVSHNEAELNSVPI
jgi:hypothetical protein